MAGDTQEREAFERWAGGPHERDADGYVDGVVSQLWGAFQAGRASLPAAPAVPAGWKMVPEKPTHDMLAALSQEWHSSKHRPDRYAAMLLAAPPAPSAAPTREVDEEALARLQRNGVIAWAGCEAPSPTPSPDLAGLADELWAMAQGPTRTIGVEGVVEAMRARMAEEFAAPVVAPSDPADLAKPEAYYVSGMYPSGEMSVCELATGRIVTMFRPGDAVMMPARAQRYVTLSEVSAAPAMRCPHCDGLAATGWSISEIQRGHRWENESKVYHCHIAGGLRESRRSREK